MDSKNKKWKSSQENQQGLQILMEDKQHTINKLEKFEMTIYCRILKISCTAKLKTS